MGCSNFDFDALRLLFSPSSSRAQVAPRLPNDGWRWLSNEWRLDVDGYDLAAVDEEGWYYALDFNYLS